MQWCDCVIVIFYIEVYIGIAWAAGAKTVVSVKKKCLGDKK